MSGVKDACRKIIADIIAERIKDRDELETAKHEISKRYEIGRFIRSSDILRFANDEEKREVITLLRKKPSKTISGVAVVAAMTMPLPCPHGKCRYCPGGPDIATSKQVAMQIEEGGGEKIFAAQSEPDDIEMQIERFGAPQSYTGKEPATRRALRYGFDPYLQVTFRLLQLAQIGHSVDKVDLIVMGGTLTAHDIGYQEWFSKMCLAAMNDFEKNSAAIGRIGEEKFIERYKNQKKPFLYLEDVHKKNEKSNVRCIGMTFEPRPDWARKEQIDYMLKFGVTRIEMGVQMPFDFIYKRVKRGHTVRDVIDATAELKDSGLKVGYHMMPGILGYNPQLDISGFRKIFYNSDFKPDMIKIYPLVIIEGTDYYKSWKENRFEPIEDADKLVDEIIRIIEFTPVWVRIMRIMRDIPSPLIVAGIKSSNLGQMVYAEMKRRKVKCRSINCREVGRMMKEGVIPKTGDIKLARENYAASGGKEIFLSFEDKKNDVLIGFLRLRIPGDKPFRKEIDNATALIRELHIYGPVVEIGEKPVYEWQHRGYGTDLVRSAEKIAAEEMDMKKILITSGIGVREYYRKLGYGKCGVYMGKKLT